MKVVIVNCFDTYEDRIDLLHDFFTNEGNEVVVVQSNFRHIKKVKRNENKQDFIFVDSKAYYKNMSIDRMASHYNFAKKAFEVVKSLKPDLLYVIVPPNSLAKFAAKYKKNNKDVKLVFDLIDLWPETMPIRKIKSIPPFTFWGAMRDKNLKFADYVITECDLYQEVLKNELKNTKVQTIYLAKKDSTVTSKPILSDEEIHLCYLGSINNIIDIPKIKTIVNLINKQKPVKLHIIGDGERREELIKEVESTGAIVQYYGKIYDDQQKQDIFDICHFGLNIMKDMVCVGLTMKSIDYFQGGLPIINNIKADTSIMVDKYNIGINILDMETASAEIRNMTQDEIFNMRDNVNIFFLETFSNEAFNDKLKYVLRGIKDYEK